MLLQYALPVFVDSDIETFQIDATKIEAAITPNTRAILPVDLEGGAISTNDKALMERAISFQNNGRGTGSLSGYVRNGSNYRITEFQGTLLSAQLTSLLEQSNIRRANANYLTKQLSQIPGILPAQMYPGTTRNAYHLYMFRYNADHFSGLTRARFLEALRAEKIPCYDGYTPLNKEAYLENALQSRGYQRIYSASELKNYRERNNCPVNDTLCQQAVWFGQTMLLGTTKDMDDIVYAIRKIQKHASSLARGA